MKALSELTDRELVELDEETIQRYIAIERMEGGVAKPVPPVLEDVEVIPLPTSVFYEVKNGYRTIALLKRAEGAAELVEVLSRLGMYSEEYDYGVTDGTHKYAKPAESIKTETVKLYTQVEYNQLVELMRRQKDMESKNKKEQKRYTDEVAAEKFCVDTVRDAISEAYGRVSEHNRVLSRFNEYRETAGDDAIALKFLRKAFSDEEIVSATEYAPESALETAFHKVMCSALP